MSVQNCVAFKSKAFNTSVEKEYFINPECYGDDVARWLMGELQRVGCATDSEPGQEDFGWYCGFVIDGVGYCAVLGYRADSESEGEWLCWIERRVGLLGAMFGRQKRIQTEAVDVVYRILSLSPLISSVRLDGD